MNYEIYKETVTEIAIKASKAVMAVYATDFTAEHKEDNSPVTLADIEAHKIISPALRELTPDIPVISEEGRQPMVDATQRFWLVDPLDGTKSFIRKDGQFTVNIALIENRRPVFAVMTVPAAQDVYLGIHDAGAFKRKFENGDWKPIKTRQVGSKGLAIVASKSHRSASLEEWLEPFTIAEAVSAGSALKFALVAEGKADLYPRMGPTMEWDTAAGHCILEAAGGYLYDLEGQPFLYGKEGYKNGGFVASGTLFSHPLWK